MRKKRNGLGRTPLVKVDTITAPIYTGNPVAPTAPVYTTPVYSPPVRTNWWEHVNDYLPKVIDIATPFIQPRNTGYQTPPIFQQQVPIGQSNGSQLGNGDNVYGASQYFGGNFNLGDFIKENPLLVGVGTLAVGFLAFKAFKK